MYVLDFLKDKMDSQKENDRIFCEYRLVCSGVIYQGGDVRNMDWWKRPHARIIMSSPVRLIVASETANDYPQELSLRFVSSLVTEKGERSTYSFYPDEEIARDLAALLSLLFRRLVVVGGKVRQGFLKLDENESDLFPDLPIGIISSLNTTHWERHPSIVVYGQNGIEIIDYNPKPKAISPKRLATILTILPELLYAESIVQSARLYALALERMHKDVDISYQLLIACVENIANKALRKYKPDESEIIKVKNNVAALAMKFGLSEEQSRQLAIEASNGMGWHNKKFTKFLTDNVTDDLWADDDVFNIPEHFLPQKETFEFAVKEIYRARGAASHAGGSYPPSARIGLSPKLPSKQISDAYNLSVPFPPLPWFERVVNTALRRFIERNVDAISVEVDPNVPRMFN
jgi:hypothetical protein